LGTGTGRTECYRIEVVGDSATFIDKSGSGTRYQILKGNPSNLSNSRSMIMRAARPEIRRTAGAFCAAVL
jgi:hypothetical protein